MAFPISSGNDRPTQQNGFTFLAVLVAMLIMALGAERVMVWVSEQSLRERKAEQVRYVKLYNSAIEAYRAASPGERKEYPMELHDLLLDRRLVQTRRHLRKLYPDPLKPQIPAERAWGLDRNGSGQIVRVYAVALTQ